MKLLTITSLSILAALFAGAAQADEINVLNSQSLSEELNNPTELSADFDGIEQSISFGGWYGGPLRFRGKVISCFATNDQKKIIRTRGTRNAEKLQRDALRYCRWFLRHPSTCRPMGCRTN